MIDTVVLAGGSSRRYRQNKLAISYMGKPLIYHTIKPFYELSERIVVVTGQYPLGALEDLDRENKLRIVKNVKHQHGMFTSVQCGVKETRNDCFIIPGDMPLVKRETLQIMMESTGLIRVPTYRGKRGHPIYISQRIHTELLQEPPDSNLKIFRDRHLVTYIEVDDPGILIDIDNPSDYQRYLTEGNESNED